MTIDVAAVTCVVTVVVVAVVTVVTVVVVVVAVAAISGATLLSVPIGQLLFSDYRQRPNCCKWIN